MNNGLPIKAKQYVQFVSALTAFLVIYFLTGSTEIRQISLYILILIGLWFGQWFNASVIVTGFVGIGLLMVSGLQDWHFPQWSLSVVLLGLMPVPYYFSRQNRMAHEIGHAIVDHYFKVRPPYNVHELMAQFVEKRISD